MARIRFQYKRIVDDTPTARIQCNMFLDFEQLMRVVYECHQLGTIDLTGKLRRKQVEGAVRGYLTYHGMNGKLQHNEKDDVICLDKAREICNNYWGEHNLVEHPNRPV